MRGEGVPPAGPVADDHMIVDGDPQRPGGLDDVAGEIDVLAARLRVACDSCHGIYLKMQ